MSQFNPILLGVNIDHVATIRQARGVDYPQVVQAALVAEQAGADGITIHLREDRRHIQDRDVELVRETIQSRLNFEMAATDEMIAIAKKIKPEYVCLVPEKREELTTEGGLDVVENEEKIKRACQQLGEHGIKVSLFIDPQQQQVDAAKRTGAELIEIHTGQYADAESEHERHGFYRQICESANYAHDLGLIVNAGHGLHYHNVTPIAAIEVIHELNIGHSIIARAVFSGLAKAVADMKSIMVEARR
ncbi:MAG: pyridoxine 5'-phosphate synthase [Gammaproteobacteria bacterium]|nr:pyridoxine 5'-phosphate synthase [Gammaproteobacteria bacterium]MDH5628545.1 pyridoxine 5'-phosphate synthase [Gammaproteobacteria bacterium]